MPWKPSSLLSMKLNRKLVNRFVLLLFWRMNNTFFSKVMVPCKFLIFALFCIQLFLQILYFYKSLSFRTVLIKHRNRSNLQLERMVSSHFFQVYFIGLRYFWTKSNCIIVKWTFSSLWLRIRYQWFDIFSKGTSLSGRFEIFLFLLKFFLVDLLNSFLDLKLQKVFFFRISRYVFNFRNIATRLFDLPL